MLLYSISFVITFYLYILSISHLSIYSKIYVVYSCYKFQTMQKMHNLLYVKILIIKVFYRIYVINPLMLFHPPNKPNSHHKPYPNTSPTIPTHDHQVSAVVLIRCLYGVILIIFSSPYRLWTPTHSSYLISSNLPKNYL